MTRSGTALATTLVTIADLLSSSTKPLDGLVCRVGGDEFGILVHADSAGMQSLVADVLRAAGDPGEVGVLPSVSIGVADLLTAETCGVDLMRAADLALYDAKRRGRGRAAWFSAETAEEWTTRFRLEQDLASVVARDELRVHYQAIVNLVTGTPVALEALGRWQHPERGIISPIDFIPVAEETGAIREIGTWVLNESCRQIREWEREQPGSLTRFPGRPSLGDDVAGKGVRDGWSVPTRVPAAGRRARTAA